MNVRYHITLAVALSVSNFVFAADKAETLFVEGNCNNCHASEVGTVGPTLVEIAAKYKGNQDAQAMLEKKVRSGGSGAWGVMPMPGTRAAISDESIKILVKWILEQKPAPKVDPKAEQKPAAKVEAKAAQKSAPKESKKSEAKK